PPPAAPGSATPAQPATGQPAAPPPIEVSVTGGISAPLSIAIPAMPTAQIVATAAGPTDALGRQLADVISNDLKNSGLFNPLGAGQLKPVGYD
ncbi:hypothetical protein ACQUFE_17705, partial [Enterococcus casseliflavus]|uniref:hypothetical protein n=1 Tax=Enterococcus casseliflavus TaxID=37734 RepID=UPI003D148227